MALQTTSTPQPEPSAYERVAAKYRAPKQQAGGGGGTFRPHKHKLVKHTKASTCSRRTRRHYKRAMAASAQGLCVDCCGSAGRMVLVAEAAIVAIVLIAAVRIVADQGATQAQFLAAASIPSVGVAVTSLVVVAGLWHIVYPRQLRHGRYKVILGATCLLLAGLAFLQSLFVPSNERLNVLLHSVAGLSLERQLASAAVTTCFSILAFVVLPAWVSALLGRKARQRAARARAWPSQQQQEVPPLQATRGCTSSVATSLRQLCCQLRGPTGTAMPVVSAGWVGFNAFLSLYPRVMSEAVLLKVVVTGFVVLHLAWAGVLVADRHKGLHRNEAYLVFATVLTITFPAVLGDQLFQVLSWARSSTANIVTVTILFRVVMFLYRLLWGTTARRATSTQRSVALMLPFMVFEELFSGLLFLSIEPASVDLVVVTLITATRDVLRNSGSGTDWMRAFCCACIPRTPLNLPDHQRRVRTRLIMADQYLMTEQAATVVILAAVGAEELLRAVGWGANTLTAGLTGAQRTSMVTTYAALLLLQCISNFIVNALLRRQLARLEKALRSQPQPIFSHLLAGGANVQVTLSTSANAHGVGIGASRLLFDSRDGLNASRCSPLAVRAAPRWATNSYSSHGSSQTRSTYTSHSSSSTAASTLSSVAPDGSAGTLNAATEQQQQQQQQQQHRLSSTASPAASASPMSVPKSPSVEPSTASSSPSLGTVSFGYVDFDSNDGQNAPSLRFATSSILTASDLSWQMMSSRASIASGDSSSSSSMCQPAARGHSLPPLPIPMQQVAGTSASSLASSSSSLATVESSLLQASHGARLEPVVESPNSSRTGRSNSSSESAAAGVAAPTTTAAAPTTPTTPTTPTHMSTLAAAAAAGEEHDMGSPLSDGAMVGAGSQNHPHALQQQQQHANASQLSPRSQAWTEFSTRVLKTLDDGSVVEVPRQMVAPQPQPQPQQPQQQQRLLLQDAPAGQQLWRHPTINTSNSRRDDAAAPESPTVVDAHPLCTWRWLHSHIQGVAMMLRRVWLRFPVLFPATVMALSAAAAGAGLIWSSDERVHLGCVVVGSALVLGTVTVAEQLGAVSPAAATALARKKPRNSITFLVSPKFAASRDSVVDGYVSTGAPIGDSGSSIAAFTATHAGGAASRAVLQPTHSRMGMDMGSGSISSAASASSSAASRRNRPLSTSGTSLGSSSSSSSSSSSAASSSSFGSRLHDPAAGFASLNSAHTGSSDGVSLTSSGAVLPRNMPHGASVFNSARSMGELSEDGGSHRSITGTYQQYQKYQHQHQHRHTASSVLSPSVVGGAARAVARRMVPATTGRGHMSPLAGPVVQRNTRWGTAAPVRCIAEDACAPSSDDEDTNDAVGGAGAGGGVGGTKIMPAPASAARATVRERPAARPLVQTKEAAWQQSAGEPEQEEQQPSHGKAETEIAKASKGSEAGKGSGDDVDSGSDGDDLDDDDDDDGYGAVDADIGFMPIAIQRDVSARYMLGLVRDDAKELKQKSSRRLATVASPAPARVARQGTRRKCAVTEDRSSGRSLPGEVDSSSPRSQRNSIASTQYTQASSVDAAGMGAAGAAPGATQLDSDAGSGMEAEADADALIEPAELPTPRRHEQDAPQVALVAAGGNSDSDSDSGHEVVPTGAAGGGGGGGGKRPAWQPAVSAAAAKWLAGSPAGKRKLRDHSQLMMNDLAVGRQRLPDLVLHAMATPTAGAEASTATEGGDTIDGSQVDSDGDNDVFAKAALLGDSAAMARMEVLQRARAKMRGAVVLLRNLAFRKKVHQLFPNLDYKRSWRKRFLWHAVLVAFAVCTTLPPLLAMRLQA